MSIDGTAGDSARMVCDDLLIGGNAAWADASGKGTNMAGEVGSTAMANYRWARCGFSSDEEMAVVIGVPRARLWAWSEGADEPDARNAKLLSDLAAVVQELAEFLDPDVIPDWLSTDQHGLGGGTPVDLRAGHLPEVLHLVNATEHGAFT